MINSKIEELREKYYKIISIPQDIEDVKKILPNIDFSNYKELMEGLLNKIQVDLESAIELQKESTDSYLLDQITYLNQVVILCKESLELYSQAYEDVAEIDERKKINIIFGINAAGNIPALKDMDKINKEHYPVLLSVLEEIEQGIGVSDRTKEKYLGSSHDKLKGVFEHKGYQIRVFFRRLPNNTIYIEMIRVKKDNLESLDLKEPIQRTRNLKVHSKEMTRKLKEGEDLTDMIIEHGVLFQKLKDMLKPKRKGIA